jgi:hypothetical protein
VPRIRTIKPEFFGDEKLAPLAALDRFVFLGLIAMADDAGRLVDNIKTIDGFVFPETSESSRKSLDTLASISRITRYTSESGQKLIQISNWLKHQKVDKPSRYVLPPPRDTRETLAESSRSDRRPTTDDLGPTTSDRRPETAPSSSARDALLAIVPHREAWEAELNVATQGMHGPALTSEQVEVACRDYLGNGAAKNPNLKHFRAYLRRAKESPATSAPGSGAGTITHAELLYRLATDHNLFSYNGNATEYAERIANTLEDPRAVGVTREQLEAARFYDKLGEYVSRKAAIEEIARRLSAGGAS